MEETHAQILSYTEHKDDFKGRRKEIEQELSDKREALKKAEQDEEQAKQEIAAIVEKAGADV